MFSWVYKVGASAKADVEDAAFVVLGVRVVFISAFLG